MRSKRHTRDRYREAAHLQTIHPETKKLWPKRWFFFGPRVVPVWIWIASLAKHQDTMDDLVQKLRGQIGGLESMLKRHRRLAAKTQVYIEAKHARLDAAGKEGISAAEFIEREKAGASAHWKHPAHGPDGKVLPVGTEEVPSAITLSAKASERFVRDVVEPSSVKDGKTYVERMRERAE